LDRDDTIIVDVVHLSHVSDIELLPESVPAIRLLQEELFIIIITNQSVIARGLVDEQGLVHIHRTLTTMLYEEGVTVDAVYSCPHHPTAGSPPYRAKCNCRKPEPGMILQAKRDFDQIQLAESILIGNDMTDVLAGQRAGVPITALLCEDQADLQVSSSDRPTYVASSIYEVAKRVVERRCERRSSRAMSDT
jgi:D-glycero-D-manno-heptose 1,7-bisphosphate phosphatase